ncbi:DNA alkylation repair protein [Clostridium sp. D53t1_180928_C8]|uniref:DNA alkylation repair protein n=1 Tax=Clostridium sp. D53t1_180928_C8 TaxID=2787101 RepID=UPI0018AAAA4E|nr:DNA alkylation repair protein [Clostridium sp. D53t1_180928_C8]
MDELTKVINKFRESTNEENAIVMKAYLKGQFEFLGIKSPERKQLQKEFLSNINKKEPINKVWVLQLWNYEQREFQYLAIDYLIKMKNNLLEEHIDLIKILIVTKSWWDTVDLLASHLIGELCKKYPNLIDEYILRWAVSEDMWLRRTVILYQLKYKENVDTKILEYAICENKNDNEFFIRKAIGWSLREYSKINREWVKEFLENNKLSPLSIREASKYL